MVMGYWMGMDDVKWWMWKYGNGYWMGMGLAESF
jgi:hypothetical protein